MSRQADKYIVPKPLQPLTLPFYRFVRRLWTAWLTTTCRVHPNPILILGNQKSGTTAIAALLAELTRSSVTLDLTREIAEPTYARLRNGEITLNQFIQRNKLDFTRQIVKEPNLTLFNAEMRNRFPRAQVVFVIRDPRDNLRSILNRLELPGDRPQLSEQDWTKVNDAWRLVLDNRWLGVDGDHYIEQLAGRWRLTAQVYLNHADEMILVRYEDFLLDKVAVITRLAEQLRLTPASDISDLVDVQFQPRGDHSVTWDEFFGRENRALIERICRVEMAKLGYRIKASPDDEDQCANTRS